MGLDVQLYRFAGSTDSHPLLRTFGQEARIIRAHVCGGKPAYKATGEEAKEYVTALRQLWAKAKPDESSFGPAGEQVEAPSSYRFAINGNIGCWCVGYGSMEPAKNRLLGTVYEAFPDAHPNIAGYIFPDWQKAQDVVKASLTEIRGERTNALSQAAAKSESGERFERDIKMLEVVLETVDYVLAQSDQETYYLSWFP